MSFNKFIVMGNLTRDVQLKNLPGGSAVAEFGVATNRKFKTADGQEREEVCFQDCTAFGRTAEVIAQYFAKGKPIFLEGHLRTDSWEDKQTGQKRSKNVMLVQSFQFLPDGGRNQGEGGEAPRRDEQPARKPNHRGPMEQGGNRQAWGGKPQREPATAPFGDESHFGPDDVPF